MFTHSGQAPYHMKNLDFEASKQAARAVFTFGNTYADGLVLPRHQHEWCQCLYAITGVVTVFSDAGSWVIPPGRASWIPHGIEHEVHMRGQVTTRSAYVRPETAAHQGLLPHCAVITVSPLLHELLSVAVHFEANYPLGGRHEHIMQLIVAEIQEMAELPLNTPLPKDARLAALCRRLLQSPTISDSIDLLAHQIGMSRRSFTRLFRIQTGMSFGEWRQQACLLSALTQMSLGKSVTTVALELGYANTSAFTASFQRTMGMPPSQYLKTVKTAV